MSFFPNLPLVISALVSSAAAVALAHRHRASPARPALLRRVALALVLLVVAIRPMAGTSTVTTYSSGVDVLIVIDRTTSMAAEDHAAGTRLDGLKADLASLVSSVPGSRFAVVVFDNYARVALPFTTDADAVVSLADAIGWREGDYGTASDISVAVPVAEQLLVRSAESHPDVKRYLVYAGDGEQTAGSPPSSFASLAPFLDGGLVLGYGTAEGGPMKERPGSDSYVIRGGEPALSMIEEGNLRQIAAETGSDYQHRTTDEPLALAVTGKTPIPVERRDPRGFELYWVVAVLGGAVLLVDLWDGIGRLRRAREYVS